MLDVIDQSDSLSFKGKTGGTYSMAILFATLPLFFFLFLFFFYLFLIFEVVSSKLVLKESFHGYFFMKFIMSFYMVIYFLMHLSCSVVVGVKKVLFKCFQS